MVSAAKPFAPRLADPGISGIIFLTVAA
jgi:hypothetical protein